MLTGQIRVVQVGSVRVNDQRGDVVLTRHTVDVSNNVSRADVALADMDVLTWLLTRSDDIVR